MQISSKVTLQSAFSVRFGEIFLGNFKFWGTPELSLRRSPSCSISPHLPRFLFQVSVGHNVNISIGKNQKLWQRLKKANDIPLMFIRPKTYKRFP